MKRPHVEELSEIVKPGAPWPPTSVMLLGIRELCAYALHIERELAEAKIFAAEETARADGYADQLDRCHLAEKCLARSEARRAGLTAIADAALEASGSPACRLGDKLLALVNAYGLEKEARAALATEGASDE